MVTPKTLEVPQILTEYFVPFFFFLTSRIHAY